MKLRFFIVLAAWLILACGSSAYTAATPGTPAEEGSMSKNDTPRIKVAEAYKKVKSGDALLVCAYSSEEKCSTIQLEGSVSLTKFESKIQSLQKDQEIIFFCT